jgi:alpha-galactosidase
MEVWKLDYYVRNILLKSPGFSWKLPIIPEWCKKRVADHISFQKKVVSGIIRNACLFRLTGQTLRTGEGDRWSGLEYVSESGEAILLFVFRLVGSEPAKRLILKGLAAGAYYEIKDQDSGHCFTLSGENLMNEGLVFRDMPIESSKVYLIEKLNCQ